MRRIIPGIVLAGFAVAPTAHAELIASESFYTAPSGAYTSNPISGQPAGGTATGSYGFAVSSWTAGTSTMVIGSGLDMDMGWEQGGGASLFTRYNASDSTRQISRTLAAYTPAETLWFGGMFKSTVADLDNGTYARVGFSTFSNGTVSIAPSTVSPAPSGFFLGLGGGSVSDTADRVQLSARSVDGTTLQLQDVTTSFNAGPAGVNYFVLKLEVGMDLAGSPHATQDRITLYLNPESADDLGTGYAFATDAMAAGTTVLTKMNFWNRWVQASSSGGAVIFDELRFGTSVADVVPEPGSAAVLALGFIPLLRRRRRGA